MQDLTATFLEKLPSTLHASLIRYWQNFLARSQEEGCQVIQNPSMLHSFWEVIACSDFVAQFFCKYPAILHPGFFDNLDQTLSSQAYRDDFAIKYPIAHDEASFMQHLRLFRNQHMARIIWRDIMGMSEIEEQFSELSALAESILSITVDWAQTNLQQTFGVPRNDKGEEQEFIVLALGKLGGQELNLSSDIDLMFVYPESGQTDGKKNKSCEQFFTLLAQKVIRYLTENTSDGIVYRVDLRLRPFGDSGQIVMNFDALEQYYQIHGRDWERYALIKARAITGSEANQEKLMTLLRPFVYRRYLDYHAFDSLREMKALVASSVSEKKIENNIKLGPGGIRQIEFLVQAFQLIQAGRLPLLQNNQLLASLYGLYSAGLLNQSDYECLHEAYRYLRIVEHRVQLMHDHQAHQLPQDPLDKERLRWLMGAGTWQAFYDEVNQHRQAVHDLFEAISATPDMLDGQSKTSELSTQVTWMQIDDKTTSIHALAKIGYEQTEEVHKLLLNFKRSKRYTNLQKHAKDRLDKVMAMLIFHLGKQPQSLSVWPKIIRLLQSIMRRSAYLSLLIEQPKALSYLVDLCSKSSWVTEQIVSYPVLLDELLNPPKLKSFLDCQLQTTQLEDRMRWITDEDLELQMEHLRQFKLAAFLHLASQECFPPLIDVGQALSVVAQVILCKTLQLCWQYMIRKYKLSFTLAQLQSTCPFAIIAYGKLGAKSLNYESDLDLVFVYELPSFDWESLQLGISYQEFCVKLAQRVIHMLSTPTPSGKCYEVDVRLRPDGGAGMLVSRQKAFAEYLSNKAWQWEHQALVVARFITGSPLLKQQFEQVKQEVLSRSCQQSVLATEIHSMRKKISDHRKTAYSPDSLTLRALLTDIEFLIQYWVLLHAPTLPKITQQSAYSDILTFLAQHKKITVQEATRLKEQYQQIQSWLRMHLVYENKIDQDVVSSLATQIHALWQKYLGLVP